MAWNGRKVGLYKIKSQSIRAYKQLGGRNARTTPQIKTIKPDDIASRLVKAVKLNMNTNFGKEIKEKRRKAKEELSSQSDYGAPFRYRK